MTQREALIAARKEAGLSRQELAWKLGVTRSHIFNVETGGRNPSWDLIVRWTKALGAPGSKIWAGDRHRFEPQIEASFARARAVWHLP